MLLFATHCARMTAGTIGPHTIRKNDTKNSFHASATETLSQLPVHIITTNVSSIAKFVASLPHAPFTKNTNYSPLYYMIRYCGICDSYRLAPRQCANPCWKNRFAHQQMKHRPRMITLSQREDQLIINAHMCRAPVLMSNVVPVMGSLSLPPPRISPKVAGWLVGGSLLATA